MKYRLILLALIASSATAQTPQQILKSEGYVLVVKQGSKEIYYRPKEVKRHNGFVYYNTTTFPINGAGKYSLRSDYMVLACKEKRILKVGIHRVPYLGKSSYEDFTKNGIKDSDFKQLGVLDKRMHAKLCK